MDVAVVGRLTTATVTIVLGYAMKKLNLCTKETAKELLAIIFNCLLPCLLVQVFQDVAFARDYACFGVMSALHCVVAMITGYVVFKRRRAVDIDGAHLLGCTVGVNLGTFAYPFVLSVFGVDGLRKAIVFDFMNQISIMVVMYVLFALNSPSSKKSASGGVFETVKEAVKRQWMQPCLLALYISVIMKIGGVIIPNAVDQFLGTIAVAAKPVALLAIGILFEPRMSKSEVKDVMSLLMIRYGVGLVLSGLAFALNLQSIIGASGIAVLTLCLTAPVPLITVRYATEYGLNVSNCAAAVNASNFVSFLCILLLASADFAKNSKQLMYFFLALGVALITGGWFNNKNRTVSSRQLEEENYTTKRDNDNNNKIDFDIRDDLGNGQLRFVSTKSIANAPARSNNRMRVLRQQRIVVVASSSFSLPQQQQQIRRRRRKRSTLKSTQTQTQSISLRSAIRFA
jgi:malate permease and related proteins